MRKVYRGWPFFRTLIDFMQMTLAESGLRIAETYSTLVADLEIRERLWERISEKYATTVSTLLLITEQTTPRCCNAPDASGTLMWTRSPTFR